jgi:hypothetical protein
MRYIDKCLYIESEKLLVMGDFHIGKGESGSEAGLIVMKESFDRILRDIKKLLEITGKVKKVIFLGDIMHNFSKYGLEERYSVINLIDYVQKYCDEIIIIIGNHDKMIENLLKDRKIVKFCNYYIEKNYCFLHGDRDFEEIYDKKIKYWIMGHLHPALRLTDGIKEELFKCFLVGKYKNKNIIILPSFADSSEGVDVREVGNNLAWKFNFNKFKVMVIDSISVLDFGELKKIK